MCSGVMILELGYSVVVLARFEKADYHYIRVYMFGRCFIYLLKVY